MLSTFNCCWHLYDVRINDISVLFILFFLLIHLPWDDCVIWLWHSIDPAHICSTTTRVRGYMERPIKLCNLDGKKRAEKICYENEFGKKRSINCQKLSMNRLDFSVMFSWYKKVFYGILVFRVFIIGPKSKLFTPTSRKLITLID